MNTHAKKRISKRQEQILTFIRESILARGFPPSIREIGEAVDLSSSSTVHSHLRTLETKGYIRRNPAKPRSIQLVDQVPPWRERLTELGLQPEASHEDVVRCLIHGVGGMNAFEDREGAVWADERVGAGAWVVRCLANPESVAGSVLFEAIREARAAAVRA